MPETKTKAKGGAKGKAQGAASFLKRKEMGLPIWAWGLIAAVTVFILYRYAKGRGGGSKPSPASAADTGGAGDFPVSSDSGGASGDSSPSLDDLASRIGARGAFPYGGDFPDLTQGFGSQPLKPANVVNLPGSKVLNWAGVDFKTQAQFDAYLKSKGISVAQFKRNHPAAFTIYSNLAKGVPVTKKGAAKSGAGTKAAAIASKTKRAGKTAPTLVSEHGRVTSTATSRSVAPIKRTVANATKAPKFVSEHGQGMGTPTHATKTNKTTTKPKPVAVHPAPAAGRHKPPTKAKAKR